MAYSKEKAIEELDKREFFNEKKASPETLEFRRQVLKNKEELRGTPIPVGEKTLYFGGAGDHKILLHRFNLGADTTKLSISSEWIVWGNENKLIRKILLSEIDKIKKNSFGDLNYEELKKQIIQEYEEEKRTSQTQQAEGLPSEFTKASELKC